MFTAAPAAEANQYSSPLSLSRSAFVSSRVDAARAQSEMWRMVHSSAGPYILSYSHVYSVTRMYHHGTGYGRIIESTRPPIFVPNYWFGILASVCELAVGTSRLM